MVGWCVKSLRLLLLKSIKMVLKDDSDFYSPLFIDSISAQEAAECAGRY